MKKLTTLLFAITFFSGMAFAQSNTASSTTNGNANSSDIDQTGSFLPVAAFIKGY